MKIFAMMAALVLALSLYLAWTPELSREALLQSYSRATTSLVKVNEQTVFVQDSGPKDAPSLVLLHGFGASLQTWDAWAFELEKDRRVLRFDVPGFGLSGPAANNDYSDAADVARLLALLDQLGLQQVALGGHSMGGRIAWNFAAAHPERVSHLILVSPDGFPDPNSKSENTYKVSPFLGLMKYSLPTWALKMGVAPAYGDESLLTPQVMRRYHDMMRAPGVRAAAMERMRQSRNTNPLPLLQSLKMPVLLVWGEKDAFIPISNAQDYLKAIPQATLVSVPHAGHVVHEEAPMASVQAVQAFLAQFKTEI
jgi:pimeloyl-ACP methyl ester carboxylesterase